MWWFYIAILAWAGGVILSFANGNRKLPLIVLLLGIGFLIATFKGHANLFGIAGIAILAAVICSPELKRRPLIIGYAPKRSLHPGVRLLESAQRDCQAVFAQWSAWGA